MAFRSESEVWAAERARVANPTRRYSSWWLVLIALLAVALAIGAGL